nr:MAG TPA: hypothetical protein [Caudoviricetes sp.]
MRSYLSYQFPLAPHFFNKPHCLVLNLGNQRLYFH